MQPSGGERTFAQKLRDLLTDPRRLRGAVRYRVSQLPFWLGLNRIVPGTYLSYIPDRFVDFSNYVASGGTMSRGSIKQYLRGHRVGSSGDLPRYYFLWLIADQLAKEQITADLAELGVFRGNTATILAEIARRMGTTAYLLDTYEGFASEDLEGVDAQMRGVVDFKDTSLQAVRSFVGEQNVRFIKGRFPETSSQIPGDARFCLVNIDCDLYAPFRSALEFFYPRMVPGGFLIMHDYASRLWPGAEKAVVEFFADKPEKVIPIPDRAGTAVIRRAPSGS
jgi:O-methyltransferase